MSGMCERCRNDAALPNEDYCRDCLSLVQQVITDRLRVVHVTKASLVCRNGSPTCSERHPCGKCVEEELFGGAAA